jgi:transcriptional regulator with XRE-family HTH domain
MFSRVFLLPLRVIVPHLSHGGKQSMTPSVRPRSWTDTAQQLRELRLDQQICIDQLTRRARLSAGSISAIEQGRFESFPSPHFAAGFARSYAAALGLPDHAVSQAVLDGFAEIDVVATDGWDAVPEWTTWLMLAIGMMIVASLLALIVHLLR